jgi:hypothetical protein
MRGFAGRFGELLRHPARLKEVEHRFPANLVPTSQADR